MRLKPFRGSIRGKTSDGNTAAASDNEISPEVERANTSVWMCAHCVRRETRERYCTHTVPAETQRGEGRESNKRTMAIYRSCGHIFVALATLPLSESVLLPRSQCSISKL